MDGMPSTPPIPLPQIHTHHFPHGLLFPLLQSHLPYSGPLLRRIQHDLNHPSKTAKYLATLTPETSHSDQNSPESPWLAAYVDVHAGRETQVWIYSSLEPLSRRQPDGNDGVSTFLGAGIAPAAIEETRAQLVALMSYIRTVLLPGYLSTLENKRNAGGELTNGSVEGTPRIPAHPPTSILVGSLHSGLLELLSTPPSQSPQMRYPRVHIHRTHHPNVKYIFSRDKYVQQPDTNENAVLPPGYRFHDRQGRRGLKLRQVPLVQDRTYIFRSKELLMALASAVVYHDDTNTDENQDDSEDNPVSWVFLGYDGSLTTLHVEPEHRGKGLAVQVGMEVMRSGMGTASTLFDLAGDGPEEQGWVYADVLAENAASRRVMEKMGGEAKWTVAWVVVEVCADGQCSYCFQNARGS